MTEYDYSESHVAAVAALAADLNLVAPAGFYAASPAVLRRCYNGIGPDRWSGRFRKKVTELLEWFEPEALIHDWEYTFMPKTYAAFTLANLRFAANAAAAAGQLEPGAIPVLRRIGRGLLLALLCQLFGWQGFRDAEP